MLLKRGVIKNKWIYHLVKSDRINALRKQYDAFLEEDKKRKERNDFILGRLDKMRYASALVPVRHKPSVYEIRPAIVDRPGHQPEFSSVRGFQSTITNQRQQMLPDVQLKTNEETYLFQEISKKYILIPKLRTTLMNNSISYGATNQNPERLQNMLLDQDTVPIKELKPDSHENNDWKSKYEILNILKNEENGKPMENDQTGFVDHDQITINYDNYVNADVHVDIPKEHVDDYPEKELTTDILHNEVLQDSGYGLNTIRATEDLVAKTDTNENDTIFLANVEQTDTIGDQLQNITLNYQHSNAPNINATPEEVTYYHETEPEPDTTNMISTISDVCSKQTEQNVNIQHEYPVEDSTILQDQNPAFEHEPADSKQVAYVEGYDINPMQALNYNSQSTIDVQGGILENESLTEASNEQEFAPNIPVQIKAGEADIPQEQIYLDSNAEIVEQTEPVIEQEENQINITESIEDFDAEQREMFYSEQTDKNLSSQRGDMEHPEEFSQNQIPQDQEYAYYENTGAEAYPATFNDEEVTQQYDPSYDQQYTGIGHGSEQEQYGEQYQEHEGITDQIEPQFEDLQYEQQFESRQQIEETLDVEDGYTAQKSEAPAGEIPREENPVKSDKSDDKIIPVVNN